MNRERFYAFLMRRIATSERDTKNLTFDSKEEWWNMGHVAALKWVMKNVSRSEPKARRRRGKS